MDAKTKKLKSSDNVVKEVDTKLLEKSKLLKGLVEDYQGDEDEIPLNEVDSKNLDLIIEYLKLTEKYKDGEPKEIPKPFPEKTDEEFLKGIVNNDDNDATYNYLTKLTIEGAINLVNAANYLQIDGLINLLAAKLAHEMCNCDIEDARKKFGIECDMTEEEVAEYDKYPLD